jgi:hypothetical protein
VPVVPNPETAPPIVTPDGKERLLNDILSYGVTSVWNTGVSQFYERQPILFPYIRQFKFLDDEGNPIFDDRPQRVFRTAAVLAEIAYVESGFELPMHDLDTFNVANLDARLSGIPDAYIEKSRADAELQDLLSAVLEVPQMQDGAELFGGYERYLNIGAGCTRHYLQFVAAE